MKKTYSKTSFFVTGIKNQTHRWTSMVEIGNGYTFSTREHSIENINLFLEALNKKKIDSKIAGLVESLSIAAWDIYTKHSELLSSYLSVTVGKDIEVNFNCEDACDLPAKDKENLRFLFKMIQDLK